MTTPRDRRRPTQREYPRTRRDDGHSSPPDRPRPSQEQAMDLSNPLFTLDPYGTDVHAEAWRIHGS